MSGDAELLERAAAKLDRLLAGTTTGRVAGGTDRGGTDRPRDGDSTNRVRFDSEHSQPGM